MGGRCSRNKHTGNRAITIAIFGLDNAGKTTTAKVLEKTSIDCVAPTIGFARYEVRHTNEKITLYDLGGGKSFREAWRHYYADPYGFIYVIDSSEANRLAESREVLNQLLQEEKIRNKPILILANKQDESNALDRNTILQHLNIEQLINDHRNLYRLELCTAKSTSLNGKHSQMDPAIQNGFDWLVKTIYENYDTLHNRIQQDIQTRNAAERERREILKKQQEERAKQEGNESDEDNGPIPTGFIPIKDAINNAEKETTFNTNGFVVSTKS